MPNVIISHNKDTKVVTVTLNKQPLNICERHFYGEIQAAFEQVVVNSNGSQLDVTLREGLS